MSGTAARAHRAVAAVVRLVALGYGFLAGPRTGKRLGLNRRTVDRGLLIGFADAGQVREEVGPVGNGPPCLPTDGYQLFLVWFDVVGSSAATGAGASSRRLHLDPTRLT